MNKAAAQQCVILPYLVDHLLRPSAWPGIASFGHSVALVLSLANHVSSARHEERFDGLWRRFVADNSRVKWSFGEEGRCIGTAYG